MINLSKLHFLTKTQFDSLTNVVSEAIYFVKKEYATLTNSISENTPAVVIEASYSSSSWYRKWSDGWIEQGGKVNVTVNESVSVTYPLEMINPPLTLQSSPYEQTTSYIGETADKNYLTTCVNITNTGFSLRYYDSDPQSDPYYRQGYVSWKACGY